MLRTDDSIRFTSAEIEAFRLLGIDFGGVRTQADVEAALADWASVVSDEQPELLEKIVRELARAKGMKLPPRLSVVGPSPDSPRRS